MKKRLLPGVLTFIMLLAVLLLTACEGGGLGGSAGCEHEYGTEEAKIEPTCKEVGYSIKTCTKCGNTQTTTLEKADHSYVDGVCKWCSAKSDDSSADINPGDNENKPSTGGDSADGNQPNQNTLLYEYSTKISNGDGTEANIKLCFFSSGELMLYYISSSEDMTINGKWTMSESGIICAEYKDERLYFSVNKEDNSLTLEKEENEPAPDNCAHEFKTIKKDPTCTSDGYTADYCGKCGEMRIIDSVPPLEHQYDEKGYCTSCGIGKDDIGDITDFEAMKEEFITKLETEWMELEKRGIKYTEKHLHEYHRIIESIHSAMTLDEIRAYIDEFNHLVKEIIESQVGEGCDHQYEETARVEATCTEFGYVIEHCINCGYTHEYALLTIPHRYINGRCEVCGEIEYPDGVDDPTLLELRENALEKANIQWNEFKEKGVEPTEAQFAEFKMLLEIIQNATTLEEINVYSEKINDLIMRIYDSQDGSGCKHEYKIINRVESTCTVNGFVQEICELCQNARTTSLALSEHNFADGKCEWCGKSNGDDGSTDAELTAYRAIVIQKIKLEWDELLSKCSVNEEQTARYFEYIEKIYSAGGIEEIKMLEAEINKLFEEIRNSQETVDPDIPADNVIYKYILNSSADGMTLRLRMEFYETGKLMIKSLYYTNDGVITEGEPIESQWSMTEGGLILAYYNNEAMYFTVDADGALSLKSEGSDTCNHTYEIKDRVESTCMNAGYTVNYCSQCGDTQTLNLPFSDHIYVEGICKWCGNSDGDANRELETYRKQIITELAAEWEKLQNNYMITEGQTEAYNKHLEEIYAVGDIYDIQVRYEYLLRVFDEIKAGENLSDTKVLYSCTVDSSADGMMIRLIMEFYQDGKLTVKKLYYTAEGNATEVENIEAAWSMTEEGLVVAYYNNTPMYFVINEDNTLSPKEGDTAVCEHNYVTTERVESTCTQSGYIVNCCSKCKYTQTEELNMLGHNYVNGVCSYCGEPSEDTPAEKVLYSCTSESDTEGMTVRLNMTFYDGGKLIITPLYYTNDGSITKGEELISRWSMTEEGLVVAYYNNTPMYFVINEDNTLSPKEGDTAVCEHNYVITERVESTCTQSGYIVNCCSKCEDTQNLALPSLAHDYADGKCTMCNAEEVTDWENDFNIEIARKEFLENIESEWSYLHEEGLTITEEQYDEYESLKMYIQKAMTSDELNAVMWNFEDLVQNIRESQIVTDSAEDSANAA